MIRLSELVNVFLSGVPRDRIEINLFDQPSLSQSAEFVNGSKDELTNEP